MSRDTMARDLRELVVNWHSRGEDGWAAAQELQAMVFSILTLLPATRAHLDVLVKGMYEELDQSKPSS